MDLTLLLGIIVVLLALAFAFSNGFNDAANVVATVIATRTLTPAKSIILASIFEFLGAYFLGTAVAKTMVKGIIDPGIISGNKYGIIIVFATLLSATLWNIFCTILGFPISASHALIGGFIGAGAVAVDLAVIQWINVLTIFFWLILAPLFGLIGAFLITKIAYFFSRSATTKINKIFKLLQIITSINFAISHGTNDGQKPTGIITFSLIILGLYKPTGSAFIPKWVIIACAICITLGIATGGYNVIKTVGMNIFRIKPINGFSATSAGAGVLFLTATLGIPVSTTHVISGAVMGTGAAERPKGVRWHVGRDIFLVWLITIPANMVISGLLYFLISTCVKYFGL